MTFLKSKKINDKLLNIEQCLKVIIHKFGFHGGFDSNSHNGQWTTEGCMEACIIYEVIDDNSELFGHVSVIDLDDVTLIKLKSEKTIKHNISELSLKTSLQTDEPISSLFQNIEVGDKVRCYEEDIFNEKYFIGEAFVQSIIDCRLNYCWCILNNGKKYIINYSYYCVKV